MARKKFVIGNWKMNLTLGEARELLMQLKPEVESSKANVVFATPFVYLKEVIDIGLKASAQDCSMYTSGAYTGEISTMMLNSIGVNYALIAHSERRQYHHETNEIASAKISQCLHKGITPVYCCGESKEERLAGEHFSVVKNQLKQALASMNLVNTPKIIIAYEPVWAIGTGLTATAEQAQEMHSFIRKTLAEIFSEVHANETSILYGGSVNAGNAAQLMTCNDIDGALVGGASLKAADFTTIIHSVQ
ncbi:MAG: triose-phosphate isomerase [Flavobacteriales bacterium]